MSLNDLIKYITQSLVKHFDQPKEQRSTKRKQKKQEKEPILFRWFGMIPYAIMLFFKKK
ncbi:YqzE family protein [Bacillus coahuilensis]|uniref:YqzE family protein n=1 Tax=Bacillus coahuilensis TaxID=408580 RepID=UPI0001850747|nr:YqzE family protein [Bacillus coahuilensis]